MSLVTVKTEAGNVIGENLEILARVRKTENTRNRKTSVFEFMKLLRQQNKCLNTEQMTTIEQLNSEKTGVETGLEPK